MAARHWHVLVALTLASACAGGGETTSNAASFGSSFPPPGGTQPTPTSVDTGDPETTSGETEGDSESSPPTSSSPGPGPSSDPDTSDPPPAACGNGVREDLEECDEADIGGKTCVDFGFEEGALACAADCTLDTTACGAMPGCGDAKVDADEECDCGGQGTNCSPAQLAETTCVDLVSPKGTPYGGGVLSCDSPASCGFNTAACTYCGDNAKNGPEACDGNNVGGQTCAGLGFTGGNLFCNPDCTFNTSGCMNAPQEVCGDGQCTASEDPCVCPSDCPDDPMLCSPCECGSVSQACGCDPFCLFFGDCCPNGPC